MQALAVASCIVVTWPIEGSKDEFPDFPDIHLFYLNGMANRSQAVLNIVPAMKTFRKLLVEYAKAGQLSRCKFTLAITG